MSLVAGATLTGCATGRRSQPSVGHEWRTQIGPGAAYPAKKPEQATVDQQPLSRLWTPSTGPAFASEAGGVLDVSANPLPTFDESVPAAIAQVNVQNQPNRRHTLQPGETLYGVARNYLGDGRRWREIIAVNPGLDPSKLTAGQQIAIAD